MDQILSAILFALGLQMRLNDPPNILGDKVENRQEFFQDKKTYLQNSQQTKSGESLISQNTDEAQATTAREKVARVGNEGATPSVTAGDLRSDRAQNRQDRRAKLSQMREEFRENLEKRRRQARQDYKQLRDEFREKLKTIKDERKRKIVENVDAKMGDLNLRRTNTMSEHLVKMTEVLSRLSDRAGDAPNSREAISSAQKAIEAAQTAVTAQAGRDYTVPISSESGLGSSVKTTRRQLASDLNIAHQAVVKARRAVRAAIVSVAKEKGDTVPTPVVTE